MAAYRRVYDSRHLQADCQEPGSVPEPYTLGNQVWATFTFFKVTYPGNFKVICGNTAAGSSPDMIAGALRSLVHG